MLWSREEPGGVSRSQPAGPAADEGNLSRVVLPNSSRNEWRSQVANGSPNFATQLWWKNGANPHQLSCFLAAFSDVGFFFFLSPLSLLPSLSIKLYFCGHMHTI